MTGKPDARERLAMACVNAGVWLFLKIMGGTGAEVVLQVEYPDFPEWPARYNWRAWGRCVWMPREGEE